MAQQRRQLRSFHFNAVFHGNDHWFQQLLDDEVDRLYVRRRPRRDRRGHQERPCLWLRCIFSKTGFAKKRFLGEIKSRLLPSHGLFDVQVRVRVRLSFMGLCTDDGLVTASSFAHGDAEWERMLHLYQNGVVPRFVMGLAVTAT